ncbi:MAG TPA: hypothetical protein ENK54_05450 [Thiotrichales bacterium]|nr:hypothetical protein [Thiotrichales bacterium]
MDENYRLLLGVVFSLLGLLAIVFRMRLAPWFADLYRRIGIEVPQEKYIKQFFFVGIMMLILGLLIVTDLISHI